MVANNMNASEIAKATNLLRGSVKYRLRKLNYNTGLNVKYNLSVLKQVAEFKKPVAATRMIDHTYDALVYFYWIGNKNNSIRSVSEALNLPIHQTTHILNRVLKAEEIVIESKLNFT